MIGKLLTSPSAMFFIGAASAGLIKNAAPAIGRALRPVVRETIRLGIAAGQEVAEMAESVREEFEDITAEALADDEDITSEEPAQAN